MAIFDTDLARGSLCVLLRHALVFRRTPSPTHLYPNVCFLGMRRAPAYNLAETHLIFYNFLKAYELKCASVRRMDSDMFWSLLWVAYSAFATCENGTGFLIEGPMHDFCRKMRAPIFGRKKNHKICHWLSQQLCTCDMYSCKFKIKIAVGNLPAF